MTAYPRPFLFCVGAQKAGTTWLSRVLAEQTPVWVDPTKEMHFFDRYSDLPEIRAAADTRHHRRLVQAVSDLAALREAGERRIQRLLDRSRMTTAAQYAAYFGTHAGAAPAAADLTPEYATLGIDGYRAALDVLPAAVALFILRDPVHRIWSSARQLAKNRDDDHAMRSKAAFLRYVDTPWNRAVTDYAGTIRRLRAVFPRVRIAIYEDIFAGPATSVAFLDGLLGDLGLPAAAAYDGLAAQVNAGAGGALPEEWAAAARDRLDPVYRAIEAELGGLPAAWRH